MAGVARRIVVEDALDASVEAVARNPELIDSLHDAAHLMQLGRELRGGYPRIALRAHRRAVALAHGASRAAALATLAATYRRNVDPDAALVALAESLALDPSLDSNVRAHTCRVAALRDRGQLGEARQAGETLERRHPDDPKVLRALAAVYRDLSDGEDDFAAKADQRFALADELDELEAREFSFSELREATPQLVTILEDAGALTVNGASRFCAFEVWIDDLRPRLDRIARMQRADPRLRTDRAYELVGRLVYARLPACRNCDRLVDVSATSARP